MSAVRNQIAVIDRVALRASLARAGFRRLRWWRRQYSRWRIVTGLAPALARCWPVQELSEFRLLRLELCLSPPTSVVAAVLSQRQAAPAAWLVSIQPPQLLLVEPLLEPCDPAKTLLRLRSTFFDFLAAMVGRRLFRNCFPRLFERDHYPSWRSALLGPFLRIASASVNPLRCAHSTALRPRLSRNCGSAPAFIRSLTRFVWPKMTARMRAVWPPPVVSFTSAPLASNADTAFRRRL